MKKTINLIKPGGSLRHEVETVAVLLAEDDNGRDYRLEMKGDVLEWFLGWADSVRFARDTGVKFAYDASNKRIASQE